MLRELDVFIVADFIDPDPFGIDADPFGKKMAIFAAVKLPPHQQHIHPDHARTDQANTTFVCPCG